MESFFTQEDMRLLNGMVNFLKSMKMNRGDIEVHQGDDYLNYTYDPDDEYSHNFSNRWNVEVPQFFVPIIKKVMKVAADVYENYEPDIDGELNFHRIEFEIDINERQISVDFYGNYYGREEASGIEWSEDEDGLSKVLEEIGEVTDDKTVELRYNGGGDSGYIESSFENGESVPAAVEDWCYRQLENHYGGWEINEGSDGNFVFEMEEKMCFLYHSYNTEETASQNLFREKF